jgi:hypothetical protein
MKHLRKYNESKEERLDHDYIKDCFVDLIDMGFNVETELDRPDVWNYEPGKIPLSIINDIPGKNKISKIFVSSYVMIDFEYPEISDRNDLDGFIKYTKDITDFLLEIKASIDKVKIKYPNINYSFINLENEEQIIIYI